MKCITCGEEYSDEFEFCPFCGAYPKKFCPKCFKEVNDGGAVCSDCGTELLPFEMFKKYHDLKEKALEYKNNGKNIVISCRIVILSLNYLHNLSFPE